MENSQTQDQGKTGANSGYRQHLSLAQVLYDMKHFEAAASLRDALVRALHSAAGPNVYAIGAGRWAQGDALTLGESTTLRVTLRAYVPETAPTVATVTTVTPNTSDAADGDGEVLVPSDTP